MKPVRFGSYSIRSTRAGWSCFARLKSTVRSARLWPPPRNRTVMRPLLLRPPDEILPVVNDFTGAPLWSAERSTKTSWRWPGVVGLYVLSAMVPASRGSESRSHVDAVPFLEGHDCLLHVRQLTAHTAEIADLAFANERIDVLDL